MNEKLIQQNILTRVIIMLEEIVNQTIKMLKNLENLFGENLDLENQSLVFGFNRSIFI